MKTKCQYALLVASIAHASQKDKAGKEYIFHPLAVCEMVKKTNQKIVALLHDTLEDSNLTYQFIKDNFGKKIADAVATLTHQKDTPYQTYLENVKKNKLARAVKIADLKHNADLSRIDNPTQDDYDRREKYLKSIEFLRQK